MQASPEGVNPLRPYYRPPSIGPTIDASPNATTAAPRPAGLSSSSFSFPDLDYSEYLSEASPSLVTSVKSFVDQALWKYFSVLMAQPFEVAKIILQTQVAQDVESLPSSVPSTPGQIREVSRDYEDEYANSSDDEPNYFTSTAPLDVTPSPPTRGRRRTPQRQTSSTSKKSLHGESELPSYRLHLKNPHSLLDVLSALSSSSGPISLWRASNSTFMYGVLSKAMESFFRGLLGAIFGIAEGDILTPTSPGLIPNFSILSSASPAATLLISTAATGLSALVLGPIDAARTRLILTPSSLAPRTLLATLRTLSPSYLIPTHLIPITLVTSTIPAAISNSTPLFLRSYLKLDPITNPTSWSAFTFLGSALDLSVRFPLETVLRRAQIASWTSPQYSPPASSSRRKAFETIVHVPQSYRGVLPTMWNIVREEGYSESQRDKIAAAAGKAPRRKRKGQGIEGLYRGWKVGVWGLVGIWGASFIGGLQANGEASAATADVPAHGSKF